MTNNDPLDYTIGEGGGIEYPEYPAAPLPTNDHPSYTPNVVVGNPHVRFVANWVIGAAAIILGVTAAVDGASPAFDLSWLVAPISAGVLTLAGLFNVAVSAPNVPRQR